jgi:Tol biopolymer transport system component
VVFKDINGNEEPALDSSARISAAVVSPDGKKIAISRDGDVWIYDRQRGVYTRLTDTEQAEFNLIWTNDSKDVLYSRDIPQYDVFRRSADASTPEQHVLTSVNDKYAFSITPDGKSVIYEESAPEGSDLYVAPLDPADKTAAVRIIGGTGAQSAAAISPDGQWLAYTSSESGRKEAYVAAYPIGRGPQRQQVSISGATAAAWAVDGRAMFFRNGEKLYRVTFNPQTGDIGKPEVITKVQPGFDWSVAPDGRFLVAKLARGGEHRSLKVILNWSEMLTQASRSTR